MRTITIKFEDGSVKTMTEKEVSEKHATETCYKNGWDMYSPAWYEIARSNAVDSFLEEQVKEWHKHSTPAIKTVVVKDNTRVDIELPFSGFYGTSHSANIDEVLFGDDKHVDGILDIDYRAIEREFGEHYVKNFGKIFDLTTLRFIEITSPKDYSTGTNRLFASIAITEINRVRKEVEANPKYAAYILEINTTRPGFFSYFSNDVENSDWTQELLKETQYKYILLFWLENLFNEVSHSLPLIGFKTFDDFERDMIVGIEEISEFSSVENAVRVIDTAMAKEVV